MESEQTNGSFTMQDIINTKATGGRIPDEQIHWFISGFSKGEIADEQASSLLMAIRILGLEPDELAVWIGAMVDSGERLDLSSVSRPTVDKHSTGGIGDKISLPLAPLVAACGAAVPQLSGRSLGHRGGTLDKMEAIPGFRIALSNDEFLSQLNDVGAAICAPGPELAPADRKLYALRDATATVDSRPLMISSIMSKKIAEGTSSLVLDIKVGSGADMKDEASARSLAEAMVDVGIKNGVTTTAFLTNMQRPLGRWAGNALEVAEAVEVLEGGGPDDVRELTLLFACEMIRLAKLDADPEALLDSGAAMDKWRAMLTAQGADPDAPLPQADETADFYVEESGYLEELYAFPLGIASWRLGTGRVRKEDSVSAVAGLTWHFKPGDEVKAGDTLLTLYTDDASRIPSALEALEGCYTVSTTPPELSPLVHGKVEES